MLLFFFGTAIAGTLAALWVGIATGRLFLLSLLLFPPMWLGNRIGARHFGSVPPRVWQTMVAVVLAVAAVSAVVRILHCISFPFVSIEVETPIRPVYTMGISTSLTAHGFGITGYTAPSPVSSHAAATLPLFPYR